MLQLSIHRDVPCALGDDRVAILVRRTAGLSQTLLENITVSFVSQQQIASLERRYRKRRTATDVLSFSYDGSFPQGAGGEVVICPAIARQHAQRAGRSLRVELERLVVHGTLHLLGLEDETTTGRKRMEELTEQLVGNRQVGLVRG